MYLARHLNILGNGEIPVIIINTAYLACCEFLWPVESLASLLEHREMQMNRKVNMKAGKFFTFPCISLPWLTLLREKGTGSNKPILSLIQPWR